jgi:predicted RecA/RadA family phage recombinase
MAGSFELRDSLDQASTMSVDIPTGGSTAGDYTTVNDINGFYFTTASEATANTLESDKVTLVIKGRKVSATKDAAAINQGARVYWNGSDAVSAGSTGGTLIGYCIEDAAASDSTALFEFDGTLNDLI